MEGEGRISNNLNSLLPATDSQIANPTHWLFFLQLVEALRVNMFYADCSTGFRPFTHIFSHILLYSGWSKEDREAGVSATAVLGLLLGAFICSSAFWTVVPRMLSISSITALKLLLPCMLGAEISWWITDRFRANIARTLWRLSPTVLKKKHAQLILFPESFGYS